MPSQVECLCCKEIVPVMSVMSEFNESHRDSNGISPVTPVICITGHLGFSSVCLNEWVLQTAYYQYRQQYGTYHAPINE